MNRFTEDIAKTPVTAYVGFEQAEAIKQKVKDKCIAAIKARAKLHSDMTAEMKSAEIAVDDSLLQAAYVEIILDIDEI